MEVMNKIIMTTGMMVGYAYASEFLLPGILVIFMSDLFLSIEPSRLWLPTGSWFRNVLSPQIFWFKRFRRSIPVMFVVSIFVNIGMWFERFVITVTSLHADFLPSNWGSYAWSRYDNAILLELWDVFDLIPVVFASFPSDFNC